MRAEKKPADRLYAYLFPRPTESDPKNFTEYLNRELVGEVRLETQRFYGGLETVEARYPGLNYTHPPHIKRLSYFPHHRRLFQAFKQLGFTDYEILNMCKWEGTLWARQRYEKDEGVKVVDTTGDEIKPWQLCVKNEANTEQKVAVRRASRPASRRSGINVSGQRVQQQSVASNYIRSAPLVQVTTQEVPAPHAGDVEMQDEVVAPSSQTIPEEAPQPPLSPTEAFRRMQALAALRDQGETIEAMDPAFEQYLKETAEAGPTPFSEIQAAQTIASVMSSVAQNQSAAVPTSAGSASDASPVVVGGGPPPEVDVL